MPRPVIRTRAMIERDVISFLFKALDAATPQVSVTPWLKRLIQESWIDALLKREPLAEPYGTWSLIIHCIDFEGRGADHCRCGLPLLKFFGYLGEAQVRAGNEALSRIAVIEVLLEHIPNSERYFSRCEGDDDHWIESTAAGEKALGYSVKLFLDKPRYGLSFPFPPQSHFNYAFGTGFL